MGTRFDDIAAYCDLNGLKVGDPRVTAALGNCGIAYAAEVFQEPLLRPDDVAGLIIEERVCLLMQTFPQPGHRGPGWDQDYVEGAVALTLTLQPEPLLPCGWVDGGFREPDEGARREVFEGVVRTFCAWRLGEAWPAIERVRQRGNEDQSWGRRVLRGLVAEDRDVRLAQIYMESLLSYDLFVSREQLAKALEDGFEKHEAFVPAPLREEPRDVLVGASLVRRPPERSHRQRVRSAACWTEVLENAVGHEKMIVVRADGKIGPGWTQAKDAFDHLLDRWRSDSPQLRVEGRSGDAEERPSGRFIVSDQGLSSSLQEATVAVEEARAAVDALQQAQALFEQVLNGLDRATQVDPEAAVALAGDLVKLVALLQAESDPGVCATLVYEFGGRGRAGGWTRAQCAAGFAVSVSTIQRAEARARKLLTDHGLRRFAPSTPDS